MKRFGIGLGLLALVAFVAPGIADDKAMNKGADKKEAKCTCAEIKKVGCGWCDACHQGLCDGKSFKSEKVHEVLAGADVPKEIKCKGCAVAAKENGECKECHVYFASHKMYTSRPVYTLASGKTVDAKDLKCEGCKKMSESHKDGYCDKCGAGLVSGVCFKGKEAYALAVSAKELIVKACEASNKCEGCGVGMLTDGKCAHCNVSFKDGKMTKI